MKLRKRCQCKQENISNMFDYLQVCSGAVVDFSPWPHRVVSRCMRRQSETQPVVSGLLF